MGKVCILLSDRGDAGLEQFILKLEHAVCNQCDRSTAQTNFGKANCRRQRHGSLTSR
jgi:hypothetical protein